MNYEVHPAAAVFPMLPDDELLALADDIAANGLQQPLVLWSDPTTGELVLIDGRNRLAACGIAGVEPSYVKHDGNPVAFVLGANNHRRHMTQGQRAMAGVLAVRNDYGSDAAAAKAIGTSEAFVRWARTVAEHAPGLVDEVLRPLEPMSLKAAYDKAVELRDMRTTEAKAQRLAEIEAADPALAAQVRGGVLTISEAIAALRQRESDSKRDRRDGLTAAERLRTSLMADVASVMGARQLGEPIDTTDLIDSLRRAADALEGAT